MIGLIHDIFNIADRYGLKILNVDTTDVTLMVRIEILPRSFQIYPYSFIEIPRRTN